MERQLAIFDLNPNRLLSPPTDDHDIVAGLLEQRDRFLMHAPLGEREHQRLGCAAHC